MDFMGGGELLTHLGEQRLMREEAVRIYAAEMVLAIEYLHNMDIIHRCGARITSVFGRRLKYSLQCAGI